MVNKLKQNSILIIELDKCYAYIDGEGNYYW